MRQKTDVFSSSNSALDPRYSAWSFGPDIIRLSKSKLHLWNGSTKIVWRACGQVVSGLDDGCPVVFVRLLQGVEKGVDSLPKLVNATSDIPTVLNISHQRRVVLCCRAERMRADSIENFRGDFAAGRDRSVFESLKTRLETPFDETKHRAVRQGRIAHFEHLQRLEGVSILDVEVRQISVTQVVVILQPVTCLMIAPAVEDNLASLTADQTLLGLAGTTLCLGLECLYWVVMS